MDRTRQLSTTLDGIRGDHVKRYKFAASRIPKGSTVLDAACGIGYGTKMLYDAGNIATGVDIHPEAIQMAYTHYAGPVYFVGDVRSYYNAPYDAIVSFETLEHLEDPGPALERFSEACEGLLITSVPNEERYPFIKANFSQDEFPHYRHYSPKEFEQLLNRFGFKVLERRCQKDKQGEVVLGTDGMFLVYVCGR